MGGNYEKDMYKQFCELMSRVDSLEADHKKDRKEINALTKSWKKLTEESRISVRL